MKKYKTVTAKNAIPTIFTQTIDGMVQHRWEQTEWEDGRKISPSLKHSSTHRVEESDECQYCNDVAAARSGDVKQ